MFFEVVGTGNCPTEKSYSAYAERKSDKNRFAHHDLRMSWISWLDVRSMCKLLAYIKRLNLYCIFDKHSFECFLRILSHNCQRTVICELFVSLARLDHLKQSDGNVFKRKRVCFTHRHLAHPENATRWRAIIVDSPLFRVSTINLTVFFNYF